MIIAEAKIIMSMDEDTPEDIMDKVCDSFDEFTEKIDKLVLEMKQTYPELCITVKT